MGTKGGVISINTILFIVEAIAGWFLVGPWSLVYLVVLYVASYLNFIPVLGPVLFYVSVLGLNTLIPAMGLFGIIIFWMNMAWGIVVSILVFLLVLVTWAKS